MRVKFNVDTQLVFQIGDPMDQGCATFLHNAMYDYANINAICTTVVVPKGGLPDLIAAAKTLHVNGFDLTMPHKTDIIEFLDECDPASRAFKCVNHVKLDHGKLVGIGLDGVGMGLAIQQEANAPLEGRHALIIGAGSVAGPIAADLCTRGITKVTIVNRTIEKAAYIAGVLTDLYGVAADYGPFEKSHLEAIAPDITLAVQCTSLGGGHWGEFTELDFISKLPENCICADVLYPVTPFLTEAERCGLKTISGNGMLFQQQLAMIDFRFGVKLPADALLEGEEAVEIAVAMRNLRNIRLEAQKNKE